MNKILLIMVFIMFFLSPALFSDNNIKIDSSYVDDLIQQYPQAKEDIISKYMKDRTIYAVRGFDLENDSISFSNFGLDDKGRIADIKDFNKIALSKDKKLENLILTKGIKLENGLEGLDTENKNLILGKMGWAHCFAMSFLTKQFFEHATFVNNDSSYKNKIKSIIKRISQKKDTIVPNNDLSTFSHKYEKEMKSVLMPLQKSLFFSLTSIGILFGEDQEKAFKEIKNCIKGNKLSLIGLKRSLTWQHVVVGYKVEETSNNAIIYIYDCNYPGYSKKLTYSKKDHKFSSSYGKVSVFKINK